MLHPDSLMQNVMHANILMQFRTGNVIVDSLIGMAIASLTMYAFQSQGPVVDLGRKLLHWFVSRKNAGTLTFTG